MVTVSYTYANRLRSGFSLLEPNASAWSQSYTYDAANRLSSLISPAGAFSYAYVGSCSCSAGSLVQQLTLSNGAYITNTFDNMAHLSATVLKNSANSILNSHSYLYNTGGQPTKETRTEGSYVDYTYDNIGQIKSAKGKESGGSARLNENYGYVYDAAGNLNNRTNNTLLQTFTVDNRNQLASASRSGTLTVAGTTSATASNVTVNASSASRYTDYTFAKDGITPVDGNNTFTAVAQDSLGRTDSATNTIYLPASISYTYDSNGNLTSDGSRAFDYDDENELIRVTVANFWKTEFIYDGKQRRRVRKEFLWQSSAWVQTNEVRYIYDGKLVIQERDGNNLPLVSYTRGRDLGGGLEAAGGIGGLLARTDNSSQVSSYYVADGNGNVTALLNSQQVLVAKYLYDPFGNSISRSGPLADLNLYRFSSKEVHPSSGLIYFGRRFYDPNLQRWLNQDPIGEAGGLNLYGFVGNNPLRWVDPYGLDYGDWWDPRTWFNGGFWGSIGDQVGSVGGTLKDTVTGDWGNIQNRYDDSTLGQAETAGPKTHLATKVCLGTATAATAAAAAVGGVEYFALGNQSLAEFNVLSEGNVFKVISRPLKGGFRVDPAHHGKPWGHTHWWGW